MYPIPSPTDKIPRAPIVLFPTDCATSVLEFAQTIAYNVILHYLLRPTPRAYIICTEYVYDGSGKKVFKVGKASEREQNDGSLWREVGDYPNRTFYTPKDTLLPMGQDNRNVLYAPTRANHRITISNYSWEVCAPFKLYNFITYGECNFFPKLYQQ